jgi:hypothetical protein
LLQLAASQSTSQDGKNSYTIITLGASNYKEVVLNWIHHLEQLKVKKYIVLCTDKEIYAAVGAAHGVLIDYNVNATLKKYQKKKRSKTKAYSERYADHIDEQRATAQETGSSHAIDLKTGKVRAVGERTMVTTVTSTGVRGNKESKTTVFRSPVKHSASEPEPDQNKQDEDKDTSTIGKWATSTLSKIFRRHLLGDAQVTAQLDRIEDMVQDISQSGTNKDRKKSNRRRNTTKSTPRNHTRQITSARNHSKYGTPRASSYSSNRTRYSPNIRNYTNFRNYTASRLAALGWNSSYYRSASSTSRSSASKWIFDKQKAFTILMYIKHSSILALLSAGHSVVWSDVDCVWIKMCAVEFLTTFAEPTKDANWHNRPNGNGRQLTATRLSYTRPHVPRVGLHTSTESKLLIQDELEKLTKTKVDIATQQGSSPFETSDVIGTAICTGFFVVNPTPASLLLISAVQQTMISSVEGTCGKNCSVGDQSVMNEHLMNFGNLRGWAEHNSKIFYGPSYVTNNQMEETHFLDTNLNFPQSMIADEQHNQLSLGKRLVSVPNTPIVIGFLPYDLFPRGDARVNATALEIQIQRARERSNRTHTRFRAPVIKKNKLMTSGQAKIKNANEWADLKENACIWHMYSKKDGKTKVLAMIRDGVYMRDKIDEDDENK